MSRGPLRYTRAKAPSHGRMRFCQVPMAAFKGFTVCGKAGAAFATPTDGDAVDHEASPAVSQALAEDQ